MKTLVLIASTLLFQNVFAEDHGGARLHLVGVVLPVGQVKLIEGQNTKIETTSNSSRSYENQKVYITDSDKNIIPVKSNFSEDSSGKIKQTIMLNHAKEIAINTHHKEIFFNIVSN